MNQVEKSGILHLNDYKSNSNVDILVQKGLDLFDQAFLVFELIDNKPVVLNICEQATSNVLIIKLSDILFDLLVKREKYSEAIKLAINILLPSYKFVLKFNQNEI